MESWQRMLLANRAWVERKNAQRADYFAELAREQRPDFLWIGCSDSRVPAEEITGVTPGELFVHRNVANLVVPTDLNLLAVLQFAVVHLQVRHVIVCGHHGCGGVRAAMSQRRYGMMNQWLGAIKDVYHAHRDRIDALPDGEQRVDELVHANILAQVHNLTKTSIIQRAWRESNRPTLHGWVYGLQDGIIHPLIQLDPNSPIDPAYRFDFDTPLGVDTPADEQG